MVSWVLDKLLSNLKESKQMNTLNVYMGIWLLTPSVKDILLVDGIVMPGK